MTDEPQHSADRGAAERIGAEQGFSTAATHALLDAVTRGGGRMAQFDHPELGGHGQWMAGGMTMIGRMGDDTLRGRVAALADALAKELAPSPDSAPAAAQVAAVGTPRSAATAQPSADTRTAWGPASSTGSQNGMRYAVYPDARRLVIETGGRTEVYDTGAHRIHGVSQQQPAGGGLALQSQLGDVDLALLRRVHESGDA